MIPTLNGRPPQQTTQKCSQSHTDGPGHGWTKTLKPAGYRITAFANQHLQLSVHLGRRRTAGGVSIEGTGHQILDLL